MRANGGNASFRASVRKHLDKTSEHLLADNGTAQDAVCQRKSLSFFADGIDYRLDRRIHYGRVDNALTLAILGDSVQRVYGASRLVKHPLHCTFNRFQYGIDDIFPDSHSVIGFMEVSNRIVKCRIANGKIVVVESIPPTGIAIGQADTSVSVATDYLKRGRKKVTDI